MTFGQVYPVVVLKLSVGIVIPQLREFRVTESASLIMVVMILAGFKMIWRSLMLKNRLAFARL